MEERSLDTAAENVHGRSVVADIHHLAHLWLLFRSSLAPLLPTNVVSALDTIVEAIGAFNALNPPGPT